MMTFGSLFAGIGGIDLGFERAGMRCVWQVEIDDYCRKVLAKHWPDVRRHDDVRTFPPVEGDWSCDVIAGGFPCQDISNCNINAKGISGAKSGLWFEYLRTIGLLRPKWVVIENVKELSFRGLSTVLRGLAGVGYDAQWQTLSAWAFGSHHKRKRLFIVANRSDTDGIRWEGWPPARCEPWSHLQFTRLVHDVVRTSVSAGRNGRISDGLPHRVERLRGLGNAVVPQVAEYIARRIVAAEAARVAAP